MNSIIEGVKDSLNDYDERMYSETNKVSEERAMTTLINSLEWLSRRYNLNEERREEMLKTLKNESSSDSEKLRAIGYLILESDSLCVKERQKEYKINEC